MRTSILSRGVIAVASLAVASAALAAVPAAAATPSGITRAQVLAAANAVRADPTSAATVKALRVLVNRACAVDPDEEHAFMPLGLLDPTASAADGLLVLAPIGATEDISAARICVFGAIAAKSGSTTLSGLAKLTAGKQGEPPTTTTHALTGDVYVTPARKVTNINMIDPATVSFSVPSGIATTSTKTITTKTISTPKTKAQKKAAKKTYEKRLKAAKKAYKKALKKAGHSTSKKAAAKAAYKKRKASAKAKYKKAVATHKVVKVTTVKKVATPFTFFAAFLPPPPPS